MSLLRRTFWLLISVLMVLLLVVALVVVLPLAPLWADSWGRARSDCESL